MWNFWGKKHQKTFAAHFKFDPKAHWKGHAFRQDTNSEWQAFHGHQDKEWQVLKFARTLDDTAALKSISMGGPQVMGFNHNKIGYANVQQMFDDFNRDIRYHIFGLFDFLDANTISELEHEEFCEFAKHYNGPGQAQAYGGRIQKYYEAFEQVKAA